MFLSRDFDKAEISVSEISKFSSGSFAINNLFDFAVIDLGDVAERIAFGEEKNELGEKYFENVTLHASFKIGDTTVRVCDTLKGVLVDNNHFTLDVVKSLRYPLSYISDEMCLNMLASAKCSAYLLSNARKLDTVTVRIIFLHTETLEKKKISYVFSKSELQSHFALTLSEFYRWNKLYSDYLNNRLARLQKITFPFESMRDGQDVIVREISSCLDKRSALYINAPTGIGKTVATLYPAIKALSEKKTERIFYLTSRNSLHSTVLDACRKMAGDSLRVLSLVSKNKLCPSGKCDRRGCRFIANHDSRLREALYDIVSHEFYITSEVLKSYAEKYSVCPFELARRAAQFSDVVVCDYNYVFDPFVSEINMFMIKGDCTLLVDEAHNLVSRMKEMYTASLSLKKLQNLSSFFKNKSPEFSNACQRLAKVLADAVENDIYTAEPLDRTTVDEVSIETSSFFASFQALVKSSAFHTFFDDAAELSETDVHKFFSDVRRFVRFCDMYNDSFIAFFDENSSFVITLADTGKLVRRSVKKVGNAVFFSATLAPEEYYRYMLGTTNKDTFVNLPSPFSKEHFKVVSYNLSTRFSERDRTLSEVVSVISAAINSKKGNYIVFLPSYSYLDSVRTAWNKNFPESKFIFEHTNMSSEEKHRFLKTFEESRELIAFAVMGGNFSEGIDLSGNKLSGAVIVGLGVLPPQRSRELIATYFNDRFFDGAKFAYLYPGMNKVFQAGGRVIRSEGDKGFLVVVDDRFLTEDYVENLPDFWQNVSRAKNAQKVADILSDFWQNRQP